MFSPDGTLISASAAPHCGVFLHERQPFSANRPLACTAFKYAADYLEGGRNNYRPYRVKYSSFSCPSAPLACQTFLFTACTLACLDLVEFYFILSYFIFSCALKQCSNIPLLLLHTTIPSTLSKNIQYTLYQSYVNGQ